VRRKKFEGFDLSGNTVSAAGHDSFTGISFVPADKELPIENRGGTDDGKEKLFHR